MNLAQHFNMEQVMSSNTTTTIFRCLFLIVLSILLVGCGRIGIDLRSPIPKGYKAVDHNHSEVKSNLSFGLLGNANVLISDGKNSILIDGFFSRSGLLRSLLTGITPSEEEIKNSLKQGYVHSNINAVVVSHTHFDHAMDAPLVAAIEDAQLIGSSDIEFIAQGVNEIKQIKESDHHLDSKNIKVIEDSGGGWRNQTFEVCMFQSAHGKSIPSFLSMLIDGRITETVKPPKSLFSYKEGIAYTIWIKHKPTSKKFLIQTSSGLNSRATDLQADVVFLGVANLRGMSEDDRNLYYEQFVRKNGHQLVVPVHWEDFYRSQGGVRCTKDELFGWIEVS